MLINGSLPAKTNAGRLFFGLTYVNNSYKLKETGGDFLWIAETDLLQPKN